MESSLVPYRLFRFVGEKNWNTNKLFIRCIPLNSEPTPKKKTISDADSAVWLKIESKVQSPGSFCRELYI